MKLNKYSETKNGATVIGSYADRKSSSSSSPSSSAGSSRSDRLLWGNQDDGEDINGGIHADGNVYVGPMEFDEDENPIAPGHEFPSESGNVYASGSVASPEVYGEQLFVNVRGEKTDILTILTGEPIQPIPLERIRSWFEE